MIVDLRNCFAELRRFALGPSEREPSQFACIMVGACRPVTRLVTRRGGQDSLHTGIPFSVLTPTVHLQSAGGLHAPNFVQPVGSLLLAGTPPAAHVPKVHGTSEISAAFASWGEDATRPSSRHMRARAPHAFDIKLYRFITNLLWAKVTRILPPANLRVALLGPPRPVR